MKVQKRFVKDMRERWSSADELRRFGRKLGIVLTPESADLLWRGEWADVPMKDVEGFCWMCGWRVGLERMGED